MRQISEISLTAKLCSVRTSRGNLFWIFVFLPLIIYLGAYMLTQIHIDTGFLSKRQLEVFAIAARHIWDSSDTERCHSPKPGYMHSCRLGNFSPGCRLWTRPLDTYAGSLSSYCLNLFGHSQPTSQDASIPGISWTIRLSGWFARQVFYFLYGYIPNCM